MKRMAMTDLLGRQADGHIGSGPVVDEHLAIQTIPAKWRPYC